MYILCLYRSYFHEIIQFVLQYVQIPSNHKALTIAFNLNTCCMRKEKSLFVCFEPMTYGFIWCHYFYNWGRQWTTDPHSHFPCHSPFFIALSYIPLVFCLPGWSLLTCVIGSVHTFDHLYCSFLYLLNLFQDQDSTGHSCCRDQEYPDN